MQKPVLKIFTIYIRISVGDDFLGFLASYKRLPKAVSADVGADTEPCKQYEHTECHESDVMPCAWFDILVLDWKWVVGGDIVWFNESKI